MRRTPSTVSHVSSHLQPAAMAFVAADATPSLPTITTGTSIEVEGVNGIAYDRYGLTDYTYNQPTGVLDLFATNGSLLDALTIPSDPPLVGSSFQLSETSSGVLNLFITT